MTDSAQFPSVSMANTKKELLEAYQAAKKQVESLNREVLDAEKARKRMEKQVATATADAQVAQDPVKRLHDLRGTISRELSDMAQRFENEIETYRKIQTAIETKQGELQAIYEIETAASDLAALLDAQRLKKEHFEQEMAARKTALETEIEQRRAEWQREKTEHERQSKEQAEALSRQRQREKEEYAYALAREKEQRQNALQDALQALEKEIAEKRSIFEDEVRQRTAALDSRDEAVSNREKTMAALEKEVESFPKRTETAVQAAVAEMKKQLARDYEGDKALTQARFEGEKNVLLSKIESLEKTAASQAAQISDLSKKSELAYEKVQDIANRAVTAARRETYQPPVHHSGSALREDKPA